MNKKNHLIVIAGPTAVGKTALSIRIAQYFKTEIVSADSRQFYRELHIGTAKPEPEELAQVKHHLINSHGIDTNYNVGQYEQDVLGILGNLFEHHHQVLLVGGSGLFVKAICEGLDQMPEVDLKIREQLTKTWQSEGLEVLLQELKKLDAEYYQIVDQANPHRIIRALEVCRSSGLPYSSFRQKKPKSRSFQCIKIGLERPREELYQRIELRMDMMLAQGLVEEAKSLLAYADHNALQTVGYQEVFGYLKEAYDYEEMVRLLKRNSRRYAKRQFTWFNRDQEMTWFHPEKEEEIIKFIEQRIANY